MLIFESEANLTFSHNCVDHGSGGAINLRNGELIVNANANLNFSNNSAFYGGALSLGFNSIAHVDTNGIQFRNNRGSWGGALDFAYSTMNISTNKTVKFIMNTAQLQGGAICINSGVHPAIIVGNYSNYSFSTTLHFKEVLSVPYHHYS